MVFQTVALQKNNKQVIELNKSFFYISFLLCALCSWAQDSIKTVNLDSVSVSAKRIELQQNAPSGDKLSRKQLEIINTQNAGDAAKFLGGVMVKDYGGLGGVKTVSVRGLSSNHTSVSYDGINIFDNQSGQIDLSKYSLSSVNSLSLANAGFNSFIPTASSLASSSSVNIETKKPDMGSKQLKGDAALSYGSFNMFNGNLFLATKVSNKDILTLLTDMTNTNGRYSYKIYYGANQQLSTKTKKRENNDLFSYHGEANWFHSFSAKQNLKTKVYYYYSNRGLPSNVNLYYQNSKQRLWNNNFFAQTDFSSYINDRLTYKNKLKFDWNYTRYNDPYYLGAPEGQNDEYKQNLVYMNNAVRYLIRYNFSATLTNDVSFSSLNSTILDDKPARLSSLTALVLDYKLKDFTFSANAVHSFFNDNYQNANKTRNYLSPFISIRWDKENFSSTLFYKNIFRMPTFNELYYRRMGDSNLKPEKTNQLSWANVLTIENPQYTIQPEIDLYYNNVKDKIVAIPKTNIFLWSMLNYGRADIYGIDLKINSAFRIAYTQLTLKLNYSYQKSVDMDKQSPTYKQDLPYMPENIGSAVLGVDYMQYHFGYTCLYVGDRYSLQENIPQNLLKSYFDHSAWVSYDLNFKNKRIENLNLMFSVANIFNKQYEVIRAYPMMGRNFNFKIQLKF